MSKNIVLAADGSAAVGHGGSHRPRSVLVEILEALSSAREAQAEYARQVARGAEPSQAVRAAFQSLAR